MSFLQIYHWVCQWKTFENRLTFAEVMGKSCVLFVFFDSRCRKWPSESLKVTGVSVDRSRRPIWPTCMTSCKFSIVCFCLYSFWDISFLPTIKWPRFPEQISYWSILSCTLYHDFSLRTKFRNVIELHQFERYSGATKFKMGHEDGFTSSSEWLRRYGELSTVQFWPTLQAYCRYTL